MPDLYPSAQHLSAGLAPQASLRLVWLGRLPNYLTLLRVASIPLLVWLLLWDWGWSNQVAGVVFAVAGFSDFFDGILARRYGGGTQIGIFLDLIGDKLLVTALLFVMVQLGWVPAWVAMIIVGREFVVMGLRAYAGAQGVTVAAGRLGKSKMIWQYAALGGLMWERGALAWVLVTIALTLTLASGIHYVVSVSRMLRSRPPPEVAEPV